MWLSDCGLVHKINRVNAAGIPLKAYEDLKAFKLFMVDVGLLGCMVGFRQHTLSGEILARDICTYINGRFQKRRLAC